MLVGIVRPGRWHRLLLNNIAGAPHPPMGSSTDVDASLSHKPAVIACGRVFALAGALPAHAETVRSLRVMLHPYAAARGELPPEAHAHARSRSPAPGLTLTGTTRTGALDLALAAPVTRGRRRRHGPEAARRRAACCGRRRYAPASVARKTAQADAERRRPGPAASWCASRTVPRWNGRTFSSRLASASAWQSRSSGRSRTSTW